MQDEYKFKNETALVAIIVVLNVLFLFSHDFIFTGFGNFGLVSQNHQFPDFQTTNPNHHPRKHK